MEQLEVLVKEVVTERDALLKRVDELEVENKSLKKEIESLRDYLDDAEDRAVDAEHRCALEWEKDCAAALRSLANETNFEWDPDGDPADTIREHISITLDEYDGSVYRLRAEVSRLREALKAIHKGACLTAQESRSRDDDRYCLADVIQVANEALSSTTTAEWLAARDAEQRRIGAAEWLEKPAAENHERFGTHFYESTTDSFLAEAASLRAGKEE
jgi:chromosome segregation ATPase